jgi:hypothetical protein
LADNGEVDMIIGSVMLKNYYTIFSAATASNPQIGFAITKYTVTDLQLVPGAIILIVICVIILLGGAVAGFIIHRRNSFEKRILSARPSRRDSKKLISTKTKEVLRKLKEREHDQE